MPMAAGHLGVTARASYAGALAAPRSLSPSFSFAYEFGGGAAIWAGQRFDLRHKFRLSRGLAIEVRLSGCAHVRALTRMCCTLAGMVLMFSSDCQRVMLSHAPWLL